MENLRLRLMAYKCTSTDKGRASREESGEAATSVWESCDVIGGAGRVGQGLRSVTSVTSATLGAPTTSQALVTSGVPVGATVAGRTEAKGDNLGHPWRDFFHF